MKILFLIMGLIISSSIPMTYATDHAGPIPLPGDKLEIPDPCMDDPLTCGFSISLCQFGEPECTPFNLEPSCEEQFDQNIENGIDLQFAFALYLKCLRDEARGPTVMFEGAMIAVAVSSIVVAVSVATLVIRKK